MVKIKCLTCNKVLESKYRHDWVSCDCDPKSETWMYIDGGSDYLRMGAGKTAEWKVIENE